jgi:PAS domain S-box-containing protein
MSALSVGSIVQNIELYSFLSLLAYVNYGLIAANSHKKRKSPLENVLEGMIDPFYMVDRDWNFTYVNKEYERVQNRNRAELLGKNVWELFPYGKEHRYFREYDRALREQVSVHFEEFNTFNGMWVSASAYPVKSGLAIYFRDITEEKRMCGQRAVIHHTRDLIWSVDRDFNIITGNEAFRQRAGQLTEPDNYRRALKGEAFLVIRERELDGRKCFEELSFNPIFDQEQEVTVVNCFLRDITSQREHVEQIRDITVLTHGHFKPI